MIYYLTLAKDLDLICEYEFDEFEAAILEEGVQIEPEWPARVRMGAIRLNNIDINPILSDSFISDLEELILSEMH